MITNFCGFKKQYFFGIWVKTVQFYFKKYTVKFYLQSFFISSQRNNNPHFYCSRYRTLYDAI